MAMYKRPNVSRIASLSTVAASRSQGLRGGPMSSNPRVRVLGDWLDDVAAQAYNESGTAPSSNVAAGEYSYGGGYPSGSSSSGGPSATSIMSALSNIFGNKPATTSAYVPTSSNTSTYLLIGGAVLGGILLVTLLR